MDAWQQKTINAAIPLMNSSLLFFMNLIFWLQTYCFEMNIAHFQGIERPVPVLILAAEIFLFADHTMTGIFIFLNYLLISKRFLLL